MTHAVFAEMLLRLAKAFAEAPDPYWEGSYEDRTDVQVVMSDNDLTPGSVYVRQDGRPALVITGGTSLVP